MATWNADKPAVGNQISADIPDIEENFQELHDVMEAITNGTLGTTTAADFKVDTLTTPAIWGEQRAKFQWKDVDEIYINPGSYHHVGTVSQIVYWNSQLTSDIGAPDASDWYYLYLDDSAIVTADTNLLTATEFVWSNTEPTWTVAKHGWYNGSDRCIFAVLTDGSSNIVEFYHDGGDLVLYADRIVDTSAAPSNTWTDYTLTMPKFSTKAELCVISSFNTAGNYSFWRTNGQTATNGHHMSGGFNTTGNGAVNTFTAITDSTQKIEAKFTAADTGNITAYTQGFYLPAGL